MSSSADKFAFLTNDSDKMFKTCLIDAYDAVDEMNLWDYLGNNIFNSFAYYDGPYQELHHKLLEKADKNNLHSGASYGITMRNIEQIAKNGFEQWKKDYIKNYTV
jgi:hypothetical protein